MAIDKFKNKITILSGMQIHRVVVLAMSTRKTQNGTSTQITMKDHCFPTADKTKQISSQTDTMARVSDLSRSEEAKNKIFITIWSTN